MPDANRELVGRIDRWRIASGDCAQHGDGGVVIAEIEIGLNQGRRRLGMATNRLGERLDATP